MDTVTIALAKGRLAENAMKIFESIGVSCSEMTSKSRKLIFKDQKHQIHFILVKASDVPTYVEYGAADIGIVGKDTLLEEGLNLYEVLDLQFGKCKMVVAGPKEKYNEYHNMNNKRVATKYVNIAKNFFYYTKGQTVEIIKLNGSVELGPLVGLSEVIVDLVETGTTLKENGLEIFEEICDVSARVVVNRVSMKMKKERISWLIQNLKKQVMGDTV